MKRVERALTCLCGFPSGLLDVLLRLVAELDLQLLGLHLQVLLSVCQGFTSLHHTQRAGRVNAGTTSHAA